MGGTIVTWLQNTEKLVTPSSRARSSVSAVDGAVVSNPTAKNTTSRSGSSIGDPQRVERRVDEADVGAARLGLEQVPVAAGHAHHVAERREDHPGVLGDGDGVVDPAHRDHAHRAARAVHQLDAVGQHVLDAVAVDRVGVPAAHLHELERARRRPARVMWPTSARAATGSRYSSTKRIAQPPPAAGVATLARRGSRDASSALELVGVGRAHHPQRVERHRRLGLVDLRHGEADVDQHPVARLRAPRPRAARC